MSERPDPTLAEAAAQAARVPAYDDLLARGTRRRRRRTALAVTATVAAVLAVVAGVTLPGRDRAEGPLPPATPGPTSTPTSAPTTGPTSGPTSGTTATPADVRAEAAAIIDAPRARLGWLAVDQTDPLVRVAVWHECPTCPRWAVALTRDGFATRVVADRVFTDPPTKPEVRADGGAALTAWTRNTEQVFAVGADGTVTPAEPVGGPSPLGADELLIGPTYDNDGNGAPTYWGVDPDAGTAHPLRVPDLASQVVQMPGGQLRAVDWVGDYSYSDSGGRGWTHVPGPDVRAGVAALRRIPIAPAGLHALIQGSDGATLYPLVAAHRLTDPTVPTWASYPGPTDPTAYIGGEVVLPDGRLVVAAVAWSDNNRSRAGTPPGLYVSAGSDWSALSWVAPGAPFDTATARWDPTLLDATLIDPDAPGGGSGARLTVLGPDGREAYATTDLGATWTPVPAR